MVSTFPSLAELYAEAEQTTDPQHAAREARLERAAERLKDIDWDVEEGDEEDDEQ